ncbi:MAG TPA: hypothetical protein VFL94_08005 [Actinomycetales bacterium]|nr:hypothetical protein [Actinomycetales bacterium]
MSLALATHPVTAGGSPGTPALAEEAPAQHRWLRPGWPLATIFVLFPIWWAAGLAEWICPIMAVPMALHLLRRRAVYVPRGFGWWLLFLCWVAVGLLVLNVNAYGAVADDSSTRVMTWAYRLTWYLTITVVLLYVVNTRREFSTLRLMRLVGYMFVTVTLGGLLGVVAPYFQFHSLMELVLPHGITNIQFVQKMIHPEAAELQRVLGYVAPRPSAPFAFTNTWGLNYALTLPFFLYTWCGRDGGWRRWASVPVILVAAVPCVYSINRGMWGALVAMALFVAIRAAFTGRPAMLGGLLAGALAVVVLLATTPLGGVVNARFSNKGSEQGRTNLGTLTVQSVARTSPIIGLGSTRNVQGNFNSITGGSTAQCPRCSPPALGTQGQLWLVVFSQGLVGLVMFLAFFALMFFRHLRLRSPAATVALAVLVAGAVTLPVYNSLGLGLMIAMIAIGVLVREAADDADAHRGRRRRTRGTVLVDRYVLAVRESVAIVVVTALCGLAAAAAWLQANPSPYVATASVLVPPPPRYPAVGDGPMTVDTDAQLLASDAVMTAAARASHRTVAQTTAALSVTAAPNTRVLTISLTAPTAQRAEDGVDAAVASFINQRRTRMDAERASQLATLSAQADALADGINALDHTVAVEAANGVTGRIDDRVRVLRDKRSELVTQSNLVAQKTARVMAGQIVAGRQTNATTVVRDGDQARVAWVTGLTAGLGLGIAVATLLATRGPRLRRVRDVPGLVGLPLLARVPYAPLGRRTIDALVRGRPVAYVSADERDPVAAGMAHLLTDLGFDDERRTGAVVVASERTRVDDVRSAAQRLSERGMDVLGVVIARRPRVSRWARLT